MPEDKIVIKNKYLKDCKECGSPVGVGDGYAIGTKVKGKKVIWETWCDVCHGEEPKPKEYPPPNVAGEEPPEIKDEDLPF